MRIVSTPIALYRATYGTKNKACILLVRTDTNQMTLLHARPNITNWSFVAKDDPWLKKGELLDEYADFTGTIERGHIDVPFSHTVPSINGKPGILVVPEGGTHAWCYYPKGEVAHAKNFQRFAVFGDKPESEAASKPKPKRKRKDLKRHINELKAKLAKAEQDLEEVTLLAEARLRQIGELSVQLKRTQDALDSARDRVARLEDELEATRKANAERKAKLLAAVELLASRDAKDIK